jgi:hypothetical protein
VFTLVAVVMLSAPVGDDIAHRDSVQDYFWELLCETRYGFARTEEAAFVVRDADGQISFVRWPRSETPDVARWIGPFPEGVIAIVHTHPNWLPQPSKVDARLARRRQVPIYVITRGRVVRTSGQQTEVVLTNWHS